MAIRRYTQRGMIRDSMLLALAGSTSTGLLAQIASGGSPEALGIFAGLGVNGLLIFLLSQANKREVEQAKADYLDAMRTEGALPNAVEADPLWT